MELKSFPFAVKAIEGRTATGITAVMGNIDTGYDRLWPGAFTKTITERRSKFRHLWNHDYFSPPIATIDDIKEVGRDGLPDAVVAMAPEASGGLLVTRTYLDTPRGNEVLAGLKSGAINEMSFGYDAIKVAFTKEGDRDIRELYEVRLFDTSDVNWGMNEATAGVKGLLLAMSPEVFMQHLEATVQAIKAGARHSANDVKLLNAIHKAAVDLGATDCKGVVEEDGEEGEKDEAETEDDEKSRAAYALTLKRADDFLRESRISEFLASV
jgi:HK97 family phage prohead protease